MKMSDTLLLLFSNIFIITVMLEMMMVCIEGVQLCLLKRWVSILEEKILVETPFL